MSAVALDARSGRWAGALLAGPLTRRQVFGEDLDALGAEEEDPYHRHRKRFFTAVHRRVDLFSLLGVSEIVDFAYGFVDESYQDNGVLSRLLGASAKVAAQQGFRAGKGESTLQKIDTTILRRGFTRVCSVPLKEYSFEGEAIFASAKAPDNILTVYGCRLINAAPYIVPLTKHEVNQTKGEYPFHEPSTTRANSQ
ncbi:Uncharacterized protein GBIM_19337 [Gryllus bimaculatus]|nr:Uncharacterized protein GBIM_19337 [Gryllus bimaculatus]